MAGFALCMLCLGIATLIAIPTMITVSGVDAWTGIAIGQTIGIMGATVIAYGWPVSGPAEVARADIGGRRVTYSESLRVRLAISLPVMIGCAAVTIGVVRADVDLAVLGSISTAAIGFTASWYFVGTGRPLDLLVLEVVPRVLGVIGGIVLMQRFHTAAAGLICQLVGMAVAVLTCSVVILRSPQGIDRIPAHRRSVLSILASQRHGLTTNVISNMYGVLPIVIMGMLAPLALPVFAILDRIQKQLGSGVSAFVQVVQGWVPRAAPAGLWWRVRVALCCAVVAAAVIGVLLSIIGRPLVTWLGEGRVVIEFASIILLSIVVALTLIESVISMGCMVPFGLIASVARITLWSSIVGLLGMSLGTWIWGVNGALIGLLLAQLLRIGVECRVLFRQQVVMSYSQSGGEVV